MDGSRFRKAWLSALDLALSPIAILNRLFPRRMTLWAFGSWRGERFGDNAKHFFFHCLGRKSEGVRAIWITGSRKIARELSSAGLPVAHRYSLKGLWASARAGIYFFDTHSADVSRPFARGAMLVNLWHGIPLKRIEADIDNKKHPYHKSLSGPPLERLFWRLLRPEMTERCDMVVSTSETVSHTLSSAFRVPVERIVESGLPRNDCLLDPLSIPSRLTSLDAQVRQQLSNARARGERILIYMPTFRDDGGSSFPLNWIEVNHILAQFNCRLICKLHPLDRTRMAIPPDADRVEVLSGHVDVYLFLDQTDALITDYSSIWFDYLLLDRPILFFPHDLERYQRTCRGFYYDYESITPGGTAYTADAMLNLLSAFGRKELDSRAEQMLRARNTFHRRADSGASARLFDAVWRKIHTDTARS